MIYFKGPLTLALGTLQAISVGFLILAFLKTLVPPVYLNSSIKRLRLDFGGGWYLWPSEISTIIG